MSAIISLDDRRSALTAPLARPLPASVDAEIALLGAIMINGEAYSVAAALVQPEHFSEEINRRIFHVMGALVLESRPVTAPGLLAYLGNHEVAEHVSTAQYLARLTASAVTIVNTPEYARVVRDMATRRAVIAAGEKLIEASHSAPLGQAPDQLAADALGEIRAIVEAAPRKRTQFSLGDGFTMLLDRMARLRRGEEQSRCIATGFADLDRAMTGGLRPSTIVLVAGRPGAGKSVVMTNLGTNIARSGVGVVEFSLELPSEEIRARHAAQLIYDPRFPITYSEIEQAVQLSDTDMDRIYDASRAIADLPLSVECPPTVTAHEIAARVNIEKKRMAARGVTLGVVLIDYLDKIASSDRYAGQRTYEIQEMVNVLKAVARTEEVCVVLLAQLNRGPEGREDKRPSLADLKSSSFLDQEAHAVIFVYREAYYLQRSAEYRQGEADALARFEEVRHDLELILGKNRSGPETTVRLYCDVAASYMASRSHGGGH